jgi:hypothetical protein
MMVSDDADKHRQLLQVNEQLDFDDSTVVYDDEQCNENGTH